MGLVLIGATALPTKAVPFTWKDSDSPGSILNSFGETASGVLGIRFPDADAYAEVAGYQPGTDTLNSAFIAFTFSVDGGPASTVDWSLSSTTAIFQAGGAGTFQRVFSVPPGAVNGVPLSLTLTGPIDVTGEVNYTITYLGQGSAEVNLTTAFLSANGNNVPDNGSTVMFLGCSLLGMVAIRRRKSA